MTEKLFLDALRAALKNEQVLWDMDIQPQTWMELFQMAQKHQILPMVYEAVYGCPAAQRMEAPHLPHPQADCLLPVRLPYHS